MEQFCEKIFPTLAKRFKGDGYFQDRAILAPTNQTKEAINDHLMSKLPKEEVVLLSEDSTVEPVSTPRIWSSCDSSGVALSFQSALLLPRQ